MILIRLLWLLLAAALLGCGAEGGPVGSGISPSSVAGNVVQVAPEPSPAGGGAAMISAIRVSIDEFPGIDDTTDEEGNFELVGDFAGAITLRFTARDLTATRPLEVPAGSTIVLQDIELGPNEVEARMVRQLGFFGRVALADCGSGEDLGSGSILVNDGKPVPNQFLVRLSTETVIVRGDGRSLQCADIERGNLIAVEGVIRRLDRTIDATVVTIAPRRPGEPRPIDELTFELRFRGTVAVVNCESGMMLIIDESAGQSRLRLSRQTTILRGDLQPARCDSIRPGDRVEGRGRTKVRRPEVIDVVAMIVRRPVAP